MNTPESPSRTSGNYEDLVIHPAPPHFDSAPDFFVKVNGQDVHVYTSRTAAFASFDFRGTVEVEVTHDGTVYDYDIRPFSRAIDSRQEENRIIFPLDTPARLSVEINRNLKRPLFLFANPLEEDVPDPDDPDVIFFEGGTVHTPGTVRVESGQTVYLAGGAVVRGTFMTDGGKDIAIKGRGILDNVRYDRREARPIEINQCENVLLEGIIINEARHWVLSLSASRHVEVDNLKIVSDNGNDDGIDVVGCQHVRVHDCFIRTRDDCVAIKAGVNYFTDFDSGGNVDDIVVEDTVIWNGLWGNGLEIGFETRADLMENIVFRNIDVLHVERGGVFTIHNGDRATIRNVRYENIRVEDARDKLIDIAILESRYTRDPQRGSIQDIRFKDIAVTGGPVPRSEIHGFGEAHPVENITLENVTFHGSRATDTADAALNHRHAKNIRFHPEPAPGASDGGARG